MQETLHTTSTMEKLKGILLEMEVPYLRRLETKGPTSSARAGKWEYWNDYTPDGIAKFMELQTQVQQQEGLLNERIQLHEQRVLKAETNLSEWEVMLKAQEERLEAKEDTMKQRLQRQEQALINRMRATGEQLEARQSERILEDGSEWEDHLHTKTEEHISSVMERLQTQASTQLAEYSGSIHELATQRELRTKA